MAFLSKKAAYFSGASGDCPYQLQKFAELINSMFIEFISGGTVMLDGVRCVTYVYILSSCAVLSNYTSK